jgi:hypothetical protein
LSNAPFNSVSVFTHLLSDAAALALASIAVSFLGTSCPQEDEFEKEERGAEDPELVKLLSMPAPTPLLGVVLCGYLTNTTRTQRGTHLLRVPYPFEGLLKDAQSYQLPGTPPPLCPNSFGTSSFLFG